MVTGKFTVFKLGDEELAIDSLKISSAAQYLGKKQKIFGMPKFILGKDETQRVLLDLDLYLDFPLKKLTWILYTKIKGNEVGFVVNEKLEDLTIDLANISPTPESILTKYKTHFITGIAKVDDRLIIVIDPEQVFSDEDIVKIAIAKEKQTGGGFFGLFAKKNKTVGQTPTSQTPTNTQTATIQSVSQPITNQSLPSSTAPQAPQQNAPIPSNVQVVNANNAQQIINANVSQVLSDVTGAHISDGSDIEVVDKIKDEHSEQISSSQRISQLKSEVNTPYFEPKDQHEEHVEKFLEKLKEDPFLKRQEDIQNNLKKIKDSIGEMDEFFEELIVDEQEKGGNFDASEEVLLSSIGVELKKDPKYLSDLIISEKRESKPTAEKKKVSLKPKKTSPEEIKKREEELKKDCNPGQGFGFWDGRNISNVEQLLEELKKMQDNEFYNHVNDQKNDFAIWIRYAISMTNIADMIQNIKVKQDMITTLENYFAGN